MDAMKIVLTTAASHDEARRIAHALVTRRQAACVNLVGPVESHYRWKNEVETAQEWLLVIKTTADMFDEVQATIRELHSYELPECIQLPIEAGSEEYLNWIADNVSSGE
jgi:periplasmic divalent cation tolerance protein